MIVYSISNIVVNRLCNSPVAASPFRIALTSPSKHCLSAGRCEESNLRSSPIDGRKMSCDVSADIDALLVHAPACRKERVFRRRELAILRTSFLQTRSNMHITYIICMLYMQIYK